MIFDQRHNNVESMSRYDPFFPNIEPMSNVFSTRLSGVGEGCWFILSCDCTPLETTLELPFNPQSNYCEHVG